jgi:hypothetical protein
MNWKGKPNDEGFGHCMLPVINTSWHDALDFYEWIAILPGTGG